MPQLTKDVVEQVLAQGQRHSQYQQYMLMRQNRPIHRGCAFRRIGSDGSILPIAGNRKYLRTNATGPRAVNAFALDATADHLLVGTDNGDNLNSVVLFDRATGERLLTIDNPEGATFRGMPVAFNKANGRILTVSRSLSSSGTNTLREYDLTGSQTRSLLLGTSQFNGVTRIESGGSGAIWLAGGVPAFSNWIQPDFTVYGQALAAYPAATDDMNPVYQMAGVKTIGITDRFVLCYAQAEVISKTAIDPEAFPVAYEIVLDLKAPHHFAPGDLLPLGITGGSATLTAVTSNTVTFQQPDESGNNVGVTLPTYAAVDVDWLPLYATINDSAELFYYRRVLSGGIYSHRVGKATVPDGVIWETEFHAQPSGEILYSILRMRATNSGGVYCLWEERGGVVDVNNTWEQLWRLRYFDASGNLQWNRAMKMLSGSRGNFLIDPLDGESLLICGNVWPVDQFETTGVDY